MKREFRLRKSSDFKRVWRYGKSYAHPLMVLIVRRNQDGPTRIAVSAGRSVGKAVQRNRAKRLLREAIKPILAQIEPGWDIVLIARKPLTETSLQQTHSVLVELMKKTKLLNSKNNHEC
ncbi:MAG: ribonuclease P protein component [Anaerolineales bacterium]